MTAKTGQDNTTETVERDKQWEDECLIPRGNEEKSWEVCGRAMSGHNTGYTDHPERGFLEGKK